MGKKINEKIHINYNEIPTPKTDQEVHHVVTEAFNTRLSWIQGKDTDGWHTVGYEEGALIEQLKIPTTPIRVVRASKTLNNVNVEQIVKALKESDQNVRKQIYDELISYEVIKTVGETVHIGYSQYATPPVTSHRDFVAIQAHKELDDGSHLVIVQSINYDEVPANKGFVRGISNCGILIQPISSKSVKIISVEHVDPKGSVPGFLLNLYRKKAGQRLNNVEALFKS